jgi:hypothetical protein
LNLGRFAALPSSCAAVLFFHSIVFSRSETQRSAIAQAADISSLITISDPSGNAF